MIKGTNYAENSDYPLYGNFMFWPGGLWQARGPAAAPRL